MLSTVPTMEWGSGKNSWGEVGFGDTGDQTLSSAWDTAVSNTNIWSFDSTDNNDKNKNGSKNSNH